MKSDTMPCSTNQVFFTTSTGYKTKKQNITPHGLRKAVGFLDQ